MSAGAGQSHTHTHTHGYVIYPAGFDTPNLRSASGHLNHQSKYIKILINLSDVVDKVGLEKGRVVQGVYSGGEREGWYPSARTYKSNCRKYILFKKVSMRAIYVDTYIHTYIYTCIHTYIDIYIHLRYTHTDIHTRRCMLNTIY